VQQTPLYCTALDSATQQKTRFRVREGCLALYRPLPGPAPDHSCSNGNFNYMANCRKYRISSC
jgi:hypothetical protein